MVILATVLWAASILVSLVCWIMVLIQIFKRNVGLGILGIVCSLFTFIYGWVKADEFGVKKIMLIWTVAVVVAIVAQFLGAGPAIQQMMNQ